MTSIPLTSSHASAASHFRFKQFQREDYARITLHDGGVLGHDTGGGKGLALFVLPALKAGFERGPQVRALKPLAPVLIVAPGDLHKQVVDEGREKFRATVTLLDSQETFYRLSTVDPRTGQRTLPPGYYLTSYTQLASNGVEKFPELVRTEDIMKLLHLSDKDAAEFHAERGRIFEKDYARLRATPDMSLRALAGAHQAVRSEYFNVPQLKLELDRIHCTLAMMHGKRSDPTWDDLDVKQQQWCREQMATRLYRQCKEGIGAARWFSQKAGTVAPETFTTTGDARLDTYIEGGVIRRNRAAMDWANPDRKIKCVYSPTLADLCQDAFACVVVDEGVKMKGEDTIVGLGLRQMNPAYRYVLTATPIKNRLPDIFRLAWWATGGKPRAHARFPYPDDGAAREEFSNEFLVSERNLSAEQRTEGRRRFVKRTPQVCNVHRLWKMFAPVILRRRKADFGEDIVKKIRNVVRAPMGRRQMEVYRFHLEGDYKDNNGLPAIGAQLQALRIAAANPASELLQAEGPNGYPLHKKEFRALAARSTHTYIPKLHIALQTLKQVLDRGEQCVVFSAFHDSLDALSARLQAAGVKHAVLDGRMSQKKRGAIAGQFKLGPGESPYQVLLAGVECMAEGHSFHLCNNVILLCYSWAYDKFEQAINRVHRLNSKWDVNVYPIICDYSIDRRLEALIQEKGEAAELVLDGRLAMEQTDEVNLAELLLTARAEFSAGGKSIPVVDEAELEKEWPGLREQLAQAARRWGRVVAAPVVASCKLQVAGSATTTASAQPEPATFNLQPVTNGNPLLARVRQRALEELPLFRMVA